MVYSSILTPTLPSYLVVVVAVAVAVVVTVLVVTDNVVVVFVVIIILSINFWKIVSRRRRCDSVGERDNFEIMNLMLVSISAVIINHIIPVAFVVVVVVMIWGWRHYVDILNRSEVGVHKTPVEQIQHVIIVGDIRKYIVFGGL